MRLVRSIVLFICMSGLTTAAAGQQSIYRFPDPVRFGKAILFDADYIRFEVRDLVIVQDVLRYQRTSLDPRPSVPSATFQNEELSLADVYLIRGAVGTRTAPAAAIGAAIFGLSAASVVANPPPFSKPTKPIDVVLLVAAFTAGGALLGAIVGHGMTKWRTIYLRENETMAWTPRPVFVVQNGRSLVGVRVGI